MPHADSVNTNRVRGAPMDAQRFILEAGRCCLLVVDIQERLYNAMDFNVRKSVVRNTNTLIEVAKAFALPIVLTEQYRKGLGPTIPEIMNNLPGVEALDKLTFDCLGEGAIAARFDEIGRDTVIIAGIETHICVLSTAFSLLAGGRRVAVASDAVCSRREYEREMAIEALWRAGAVVYPTESIAFMLMRKSGTDEFKTLSPLFK